MSHWSLRKPAAEVVRRFLADQAGRELTYAAVGATSGAPPAGYVVDQTRGRIGTGPAAFEAARRALERWEQFRLGWSEPAAPEAPIEVGAVVGVVARVCGVWWLNACRIVAVFDETGPVVRFGFAYGTLPGHAESGEERFLVEWDRADDGVWYDVRAFSRPRHPLARLGYPLTRRIQKHFARESTAAMRRAVQFASEPR